MKGVLFKLYCLGNNLKLEYTLTGTAALSLMGFPTAFRPQDIDILVNNSTEEQKAEFEKLQFLSGLDKQGYANTKCYAFIICGVKVNVMFTDLTREELLAQSNYLVLTHKAERFGMNVQKVDKALEAKMKLKRPKDKEYLLDVIGTMINISRVNNR